MTGIQKTITLSSDAETIRRLIEMAKKMRKTRSRMFREMVDFFYKHKKNLIDVGITIKETS